MRFSNKTAKQSEHFSLYPVTRKQSASSRLKRQTSQKTFQTPKPNQPPSPSPCCASCSAIFCSSAFAVLPRAPLFGFSSCGSSDGAFCDKQQLINKEPGNNRQTFRLYAPKITLDAAAAAVLFGIFFCGGAKVTWKELWLWRVVKARLGVDSRCKIGAKRNPTLRAWRSAENKSRRSETSAINLAV